MTCGAMNCWLIEVSVRVSVITLTQTGHLDPIGPVIDPFGMDLLGSSLLQLCNAALVRSVHVRFGTNLHRTTYT